MQLDSNLVYNFLNIYDSLIQINNSRRCDFDSDSINGAFTLCHRARTGHKKQAFFKPGPRSFPINFEWIRSTKDRKIKTLF